MRSDRSTNPSEGRGSLFPTTIWSRVVAAGGQDATATVALGELCARYRAPARRFLRALGCRPEEAEDLTQEFLLRLSRPGALERLTPELGRLRAWMRTTLRRMWWNARRDAAAARRGNGVPDLPLEDWDAPLEDASLEASYDREWAHALLRRVLAELRADYAARGAVALFDALAPGLSAPDAVQPYAEIGLSLGMKDVQVKVAMHRLRRRFADALRAEVAETVANAAEVDDELRHLLRAAAHECADA